MVFLVATATSVVDHAIAARVRELLAERGWRHSDLATKMRQHGCDWTTNRVAQFVTLRRGLSLVELSGLCAALSVTLSQLLDSGELVTMPAGHLVPLGVIRESLLTGRGVGFLPATEGGSSDGVPAQEMDRAARKLGVSVSDVMAACRRLYGAADITAERDRRVGDTTGYSSASVRAKRGHAMRAVLCELAEATKIRGLAC
jgi:DNA-binding Xre family transcriptional regulator